MMRDRESKALARKADAEKGVPYLLGSNLAYLLSLGQVAAQEDLPSRVEGTNGGPKASTYDDTSEGP